MDNQVHEYGRVISFGIKKQEIEEGVLKIRI